MALAIIAGVGVYASLGGVLPMTGSVAGFLLLLLGLVIARSQPLFWGAAVVAAAYIGSLYPREIGFDAASVVVGLALLASSELAHWSIDCRVPSVDDMAVHTNRAIALVVVLAIALAAAAMVVAAAALGTGGAAAGVIAVAAVVLSVILLVLAAWRGRLGSVETVSRP